MWGGCPFPGGRSKTRRIMGQGRSRTDQVMTLKPNETSSSKSLHDKHEDTNPVEGGKRSSFVGRRSFSFVEGLFRRSNRAGGGHRASGPIARDTNVTSKRRAAHANEVDGAVDDHYYTPAEKKQMELDKKKKEKDRLKRKQKGKRGSIFGGGTSDKGTENSGSSDEDGAPRVKYKGKIQWRRGELLGTGAYGNVYLGLNQETGELMGAKQIMLVDMHSQDMAGQIQALQTEISLMRGLSHENIVRYWGSELDHNMKTLTIFMEYVSGGSVSALLKKFGNFNERVVRLYTGQILSGLEYLHSHRIMHRDVKGANILVDHAGTCKLADFGASKRLDILTNADGERSLRGTPYWMAPEVVKQSGHGRQADIWSVGCTVIEMCTGKPPFSNFTTHVAVLFHIAVSTTPPEFPENVGDEGHEFLSLCFQHEPRERPSARALLKHPFITETGPPIMTDVSKLERWEDPYDKSNIKPRDGDGHLLPPRGLTPQEAPWISLTDSFAPERQRLRDLASNAQTRNHRASKQQQQPSRDNASSKPKQGSSRKQRVDSFNFEWNEGIESVNNIAIGMGQGEGSPSSSKFLGTPMLLESPKHHADYELDEEGHQSDAGSSDGLLSEDEGALKELAAHLGIEDFGSDEEDGRSFSSGQRERTHVSPQMSSRGSKVSVAPAMMLSPSAVHDTATGNKTSPENAKVCPDVTRVLHEHAFVRRDMNGGNEESPRSAEHRRLMDDFGVDDDEESLDIDESDSIDLSEDSEYAVSCKTVNSPSASPQGPSSRVESTNWLTTNKKETGTDTSLPSFRLFGRGKRAPSATMVEKMVRRQTSSDQSEVEEEALDRGKKSEWISTTEKTASAKPKSTSPGQSGPVAVLKKALRIHTGETENQKTNRMQTITLCDDLSRNFDVQNTPNSPSHVNFRKSSFFGRSSGGESVASVTPRQRSKKPKRKKKKATPKPPPAH